MYRIYNRTKLYLEHRDLTDIENEFILICNVIPILWITKKIMSRVPQVEDMEYRETT
jgi:hypothetical protein